MHGQQNIYKKKVTFYSILPMKDAKLNSRFTQHKVYDVLRLHQSLSGRTVSLKLQLFIISHFLEDQLTSACAQFVRVFKR